MHIDIHVDHHSDNRLPVKLQIDLELVSVVLQQLRAPYFWLVDVLVVIVIMKDSENLWERRARSEDHANPVVNQAAGNLNRFAIFFFRVQLLNVDLAVTELRVCFLPGHIGKAIDAEEMTVAQSVGHRGLVGTNIAIKGSRSVRFQFCSLCRNHKQANYEASEQEEHRVITSDQ